VPYDRAWRALFFDPQGLSAGKAMRKR